MTRRVLPLACLLALSPSCHGGPTGPEPITGTYALAQFNDKDLPVTESYPGEACILLQVLSGSLALQAPDGFTMALTVRTQEPCGQPWDQQRRSIHGVWAAAGGTISLFPDPASDFWDMSGSVGDNQVYVVPDIPADDSDSAVIRSFTFRREY